MAVLTEEQVILGDQAKAWTREQASIATFRKMRDDGENIGFLPETWKAICELGWSGILIPEEYGGSGMDYRTFGVVLEETGRRLTASPLLASGLVGATALILGGSEDSKREWLPKIANGTAIVTLAVDEAVHHAPQRIALSATKTAAGYTLNGNKSFVLEGAAADALIVAVRTNGEAGDTDGITLLLVETSQPGISRCALKTADCRGYADIGFDNVQVTEAALLGEEDQGFPVLDAVLDCGRAGLAAEMLGTGSEAFEITLEYLKTREQFGQVIGSFQSLGHRAATHFMEMELARSCVEGALVSLDNKADDAAQLCSLAKCQIGDFLYDMSNDMIQMHGGIGMTDEFDAGLFLKRARTTEAIYGNRSFHLNRYIGHYGI